MSTIDLFLEELKSHYKQEFELKSTLENKANYLLIAAGVTMTLLFSFGSTLIGNLNLNYQYLYYVISFLLLGIITNGISILFAVLAFTIKPYRFVFPHNIFFDKDGMFNTAIINDYKEGTGKTEDESKKNIRT
jgi:hypothetical protein